MPERLTPNRFTDKELKYSYWFVTNKVFLQRMLIVLILVFNMVLILFITYRLVDNYILSWDTNKIALQSLTNSSKALSGIQSQSIDKASDMQILGTQVFTDDKGHYDIITLIKNPNKRYAGYFEYRYVTIGGESEWKKGFILPLEEKYLHKLNFESEVRVLDANLEIRDFEWQQVLQYEKIAEQRLNFEIEELEFIPSFQSELTGNIPVSKVSFILNNKSSFNYRQVGLLVLLYRGAQVVGVNYVKLDDVLANSEYDVETAWYYSIGSVISVDVLPEVNILDSSVFKGF